MKPSLSLHKGHCVRINLETPPLVAGALLALAAACPPWAWAADGTGPVTPRFVEETDIAGLQSRFEGQGEYMVGGGVATFDCDGDGLPEVYVTAGVNKAKLYRNRSAHGAALKLQEERSGLELTNAIGAYPLDINGDGQMDLVVLRAGNAASNAPTPNGASRPATSGIPPSRPPGKRASPGPRWPSAPTPTAASPTFPGAAAHRACCCAPRRVAAATRPRPRWCPATAPSPCCSPTGTVPAWPTCA
jgi:hypothetical protein